MTIASQTSRISYNGDGVTASFAVPFKFLLDSDLVVYVRDTLGNQALQVLGSNYNVTGAGVDAGGAVTFASVPGAGWYIVIYRDPPVTQTTSYNNNDPFPAKSHENALDKLTMLVQRLVSRIGRIPSLLETSSFSNLVLPDPEAGKYIRWRVDQRGFENVPAITLAPNNYAIATQSEAEAGALNNVLMTPLRVDQWTASIIASQPDAEAGIRNDVLITPKTLAQGARSTQPIKEVVPFVFDMHWKALRGIPWDAAEGVGGIVPYTLASPAAVNATTITLTGAVPVAQQLIVLRGTDGTYYSVSVDGVAGAVVSLHAPLQAAVSAGQNAWNFYNNESHPNAYGYRVIADELVRHSLIAEREVWRGGQPDPVGTATAGPYLPGQSATNPGSATAPSYLVTPAAVQDGCSWTFRLKTAGQHRIIFKINTALGIDLIARLYLNGTGVYQWNMPNIADGYPQELNFTASDLGDFEFRLFRSTGTNIFLVSYPSVQQISGPCLTRFDTGTHVMFGDSWFIISSDDGFGDYGIIDRLRERYPAATFINKGVGGNNSALLVARVDADIVALAATTRIDFVHIMCGTNDYYGGRDPDTVGRELGLVVSRVMSIGAVPILYTGSVGAPTVDAARFNLSRRYVRDIGYWEHKRDVRRHSFSAYAPAGATVPLVSLGTRIDAFRVGEHYLSHACDMNEGSAQPAGTLIASIASGFSSTPATLTPAAKHFVQLLHTNGTGAAYTVSGYLDIDEKG